MKKLWKILRGILIGIIALIVIVLVGLQIALRPSVLAGLVNKYSPQFIQGGNLEFSSINAHVIKSFPFVSLEARDVAVTYPHERYARFDSLAAGARTRFSLMKAGLARDGSGIDTLISARRLYASLNYISFAGGAIDIHKVELEKPRFFMHVFDSTASNLDIFGSGEKEEEEDTTSSGMPNIILHKISLDRKPFVVYTSPADTTFLAVRGKRLALDGKLRLKDYENAHSSLEGDSLFVSGRLPADTLALGLDHLRASIKRRNVLLDADARAFLMTNSFGRMRLPIHLDADATFPKHKEAELGVNIHSLTARVSSLELKAKGDILNRPGGLDLDIDAAIEDCPIGDLMKEFRNNIEFFKKIDTDAHISLDAHAEGTIAEDSMPAVNAKLLIPLSTVDIQGVGRKGRLSLDADVVTDNFDVIDATVHKLYADIAGAKIDLSASGRDVTGEDPDLALDGTFRARLDSLTRAFLDGIDGEGLLKGEVHGKASLSQLTDMSKIAKANIQASITGSDLTVDMPKDSVHAFIRNISLNAATAANRIDSNLPKGARVLSLKADIDTLNATYGENVYARGSGVKLLAQNSADILKGGKQLTPLMGLLKVDRLSLRDYDGMDVALKGNVDRFRIIPPETKDGKPLLKISTDNEAIAAVMDGSNVAVRNLSASVSAREHVRVRNRERRNRILDSLQRVYPGTPRDSLFRKARMERMAAQLKDEFASADVMLSLSKSSQEMAKKWDFEGSVGLDLARLNLDGLSLTPEITEVAGTFDNDKVELKNITVTAGQSDISANARVSGLRRLLTGRGKPHIHANATATSTYIDANELMQALQGMRPAPSEEENPAQPADTAAQGLLILPSNLDVNVILENTGIKYDSLLVNWLAADIVMKDRTLQITNGLAASNMGDLYVEGFYSTRSKEDLKAGFDLNIVDISAEKVLTLIPEVKKEMPIMNSFSGDLDMEIAATTEIDTAMNVVLPSLDGIIRFTGRKLALKDSKEFTKIAKLLLFKDKTKAVIDNMSVTGMVRSNKLEVFPFVLDVDRYMMAASGVQNLDESFNYHISVIRSPLVLKFGLNAWGEDFDHIKYALGKARYTSPNVPVFTKQLDTVQYNLVAAIHNVFELGVDRAMAENTSQTFLQDRINQVGYSEYVDTLAMDEVIMASLEEMESTTGNVTDRVAARLETLKAEVVELERKAAVGSGAATPVISREAEGVDAKSKKKKKK